MYNVVKGNAPGLTHEKVNKLALHKTSLIKLTEKVPIKEKRKILVQKGGGFPPFSLPLVAPSIAEAVSKIAEAWSYEKSVPYTTRNVRIHERKATRFPITYLTKVL